ncbi:MAG: hypothetical protein WKF73_07960 [Nocardioidaceae bacterium]
MRNSASLVSAKIMNIAKKMGLPVNSVCPTTGIEDSTGISMARQRDARAHTQAAAGPGAARSW